MTLFNHNYVAILTSVVNFCTIVIEIDPKDDAKVFEMLKISPAFCGSISTAFVMNPAPY